jgi:hypothetical protein
VSSMASTYFTSTPSLGLGLHRADVSRRVERFVVFSTSIQHSRHPQWRGPRRKGGEQAL